MSIYARTEGLCPLCAQDSPGHYEEGPGGGMFLTLECPRHGRSREKVESDAAFFRRAYEEEYPRALNHLVLPVTYRCNLRCAYCYTLSNSSLPLPPDRTTAKLVEICAGFGGDVTLIGGEPTVREDLPDLIRSIKGLNAERKVSLSTNGQKLADAEYLEELKAAGLDFVLLSYNDIRYDRSETVCRNKAAALDNCLRLEVPVWIQQTIDELSQLDTVLAAIERCRKVVFHVSVRSVRPFGIKHPEVGIFVSEILRYLGRERDFVRGTNPFNRYTRLKGRNAKICCWINDVRRLDPIDYQYFISTDRMMPFHRGMKVDEVLLMGRNFAGRDCGFRELPGEALETGTAEGSEVRISGK